jgi:DNA topoisomerase VI subunit B
MINFESFDPLMYKSTAETEVAARALKREIKEILGSYVGWYDPFAELIQNSLDSIDSRKIKEDSSYEPSIWITIDIQNQKLIVTDNGVGLNKQQFNQFLVPFFSFKSQDGKTRGHKGVGAT